MNIITVVLKNRSDTVSVCGLSQWDYGQILQVTGLDLSGHVEVHFSLQETGGSALVATATVKDGVLTAPIPNVLLTEENRKNRIYVFIYLEDGESGQTVRKVVLYVRARPKPEDYVYTETEVFSYKALADRVTALEENGVGDGVEQVQADWNKNDETALDYVKNRPFYEGTTVTDISGQEYTITHADGSSVATAVFEHNANLPLELGQTWDYRGYPSEVQEDDNGELYFGDLNLNTIPFYIKKNSGSFNSLFLKTIGYPTSFTLVCVSGSVHTTTVKQLDEKFIPDIIARVSDIPEVPEQVQPDWDEEDETSPSYILNKPESLGGGVTWLSIVEYNCSTSSSSLKILNNNIIVKGLVESDTMITEGDSTTIDEIISFFKNGVVRCKLIGSGGLLGYGTMTGYYSNSSRFVLLVTYTTFGTGVQNKVYYFNSSSTTSTSTSTTTSTTTTSTTTTTTSTNV